MLTSSIKSIIKNIYNRKVPINITDSGLTYKVYYTQESLKNFEKIAEYILKKYKQAYEGKRLIVAIAGPPGSGKSTISKVLHSLISKKLSNVYILPLDGFHFPNDYLKSHTKKSGKKRYTLYDLKGAHFTFDYRSFKESLELVKKGKNIYWPLYSRKIHDPIPYGIKVKGNGIILIEGNYILLDKAPWNETCRIFGIKIFIKPCRFLLKRRIIKRKLAGGHNRRNARAHYKSVDRYNINMVLNYVCRYDILIKQAGIFKYKCYFNS